MSANCRTRTTSSRSASAACWSWRGCSSHAAAMAASLVTFAACGEGVNRYVSVSAPTVALTHVRIIDGTGGPGKDRQTLVLQDGRIQAVGDDATVAAPPSARVLDLRGRTI